MPVLTSRTTAHRALRPQSPTGSESSDSDFEEINSAARGTAHVLPTAPAFVTGSAFQPLPRWPIPPVEYYSSDSASDSDFEELNQEILMEIYGPANIEPAPDASAGIHIFK